MKTDRYEDAPEEVRKELASSNVIEDFLPPPEKLVVREETRKITITLSQRSVEFFKEKSKDAHVPYQQMIRNVLDRYTNAYSKNSNSR